jgi:hypothetical protein
MNDQGCNKVETKVLDEFISRIIECCGSVNSRVNLVNDISDRLNGPTPKEGGVDSKQSDPMAIFEKINLHLSSMEHHVRDLESATDRLNSII